MRNRWPAAAATSSSGAPVLVTGKIKDKVYNLGSKQLDFGKYKKFDESMGPFPEPWEYQVCNNHFQEVLAAMLQVMCFAGLGQMMEATKIV